MQFQMRFLPLKNLLMVSDCQLDEIRKLKETQFSKQQPDELHEMEVNSPDLDSPDRDAEAIVEVSTFLCVKKQIQNLNIELNTRHC